MPDLIGFLVLAGTDLISGHWGVSKSRDHRVRDALGEDLTLTENFNLNDNLATLRCTLISLISRLAHQLSSIVAWHVILRTQAQRSALASRACSCSRMGTDTDQIHLGDIQMEPRMDE